MKSEFFVPVFRSGEEDESQSAVAAGLIDVVIVRDRMVAGGCFDKSAAIAVRGPCGRHRRPGPCRAVSGIAGPKMSIAACSNGDGRPAHLDRG
jgi:hypothetical protein